MFHFMALQDNEIEPMGERTRTDLQRGMAYVEGRPVAGSCRTASYRHNHRKGIKTPAHAVGLYARVSRSDQKKDLEAQLGRLVVYADHHRLTIVQAVSEVGSGLNGRRPKLIKLLANPKIQTIVVEHRERLMRFGAEYVEAALTAQERKLLVMESSEVNDDLVQDMIEVLTSFCARLYGRRSARHKAKKALHALGQ